MNGTYLVGTTCRRGRHLGCILFSATCSACTFRPHAGLQGMTRCYMQLLDFTGSDILHFLLRALYSYGFIFLAASISPFPLLLTSRGLFGQLVLFLKKLTITVLLEPFEHSVFDSHVTSVSSACTASRPFLLLVSLCQ